MLADEVVDRKPETEEARAVILGLVMDQTRELLAAERLTVTCPCGGKAGILFAYHCYHCGVWFCRRCASRHFGEPT
jgi:hypothetical protein